MRDLPARHREIKDLEHLGDKNTYETVRTLNKTFVTPFDHEDISVLAAGLDDILHYIEEIADTVSHYGIFTIPASAVLAALVVEAGLIALAILVVGLWASSYSCGIDSASGRAMTT